jgi:hypothetical protein
MTNKQRLSTEEARLIGTQLNIDWSQINFEQFRRGLEMELEHSAIDPQTDDLMPAGKTAWKHLKDIRDYYTILERIESEPEFHA